MRVAEKNRLCMSCNRMLTYEGTDLTKADRDISCDFCADIYPAAFGVHVGKVMKVIIMVMPVDDPAFEFRWRICRVVDEEESETVIIKNCRFLTGKFQVIMVP